MSCPAERKPETVWHNRQKGFFLLPVVLAITLIAVIAFLLNSQRVIGLDVTTAMTEAKEADEVARAGFAHAQWLVNASGCQGDLAMAPLSFGSGGAHSYTATVDAGGVTTSQHTFNPDRDTWIREFSPDSNYGGDNTLRVKNSATDSNHALYHFNLASIPANSRVVTATLWLYVTQPDDHGGLQIHRITQDWSEYDATWNSINNGFEVKPYSRVAPISASGVWVSANLTALAQSWVNNPGSNHGLLIAATSSILLSIYSSREAASDIRPYLEVTTAGSDVSPVQISVTGSFAADALGNSVTRTVSRSNIPAYQPLNRYIVHGPGELKDAWVNSSKPSLNFGSDEILQVAESGVHRSLLYFSLAGLIPGSRIHSASLELYASTVSNPGLIQVHALTQPWEEGSCAGVGCTADGATWETRNGSDAWMEPGADYEGVLAASSHAATVSDWHRWDITGLVREWSAGTRPNHGLLLQSGPAVDVNYVSSESVDTTHHPRLVIQYACECGSPCLAPQGSGKVLMVVDSSISPASEDLFKLGLLESWGYAVQMIGDEATQAEYDSEFGVQEVVYVSSTVDPVILGSKLDNASIAVISEAGDLNANLGFSLGNSLPVGGHIEVTDNTHSITELFPVGQFSIYDANMGGLAVSSTLSPDLQLLALWGTSGTLAVLESGATLAGGGTAAGPRAMLPFGRNLDWGLVNNSGLLVLQRALDWGIVAAMESTSCNGSYRDEFNVIGYSGSDGTLGWTTDWLETGDSGDASSGDVQVMSDLGDTRLMIKNKSRYVEREVDLTGGGTAALSFDYRRSRLDDPADRVAVQVSGDGGNSWNLLEGFSGPDNDAVYKTASYDISSFIATNTRIRFISSSVLGKQDDVFFDNVQITCTP